MNKIGTEGIGVITKIILAMLVLVVVLFIILKALAPTQSVISDQDLLTKNRVCYLNQKGQPKDPCLPSQDDKDGDCLPDWCDFCVGPDTKVVTDGRSRQAAGSNLIDSDRDLMPDLCDSEPQNAKVNGCKFDSNGKCKIPTKYIGSDKKEITLASILPKESDWLKPDDIIRIN